MAAPTLILSLTAIITLLISGCGEVHASHHHHHHHHRCRHFGHNSHHTSSGNDLTSGVPKRLFVFGDSYADTGNNPRRAKSWNAPYGISFPGKPTGRFSDGRVLTDFIAKFLRIKTPVAYKSRKFAGKNIKFGVNYAVGGTGVFQTQSPGPNMTVQIGFLEEMMKDSVFSAADVNESIALVTLSGNDYGDFIAKNPSTEALLLFIRQVVNQLAENLRRIYSLGMKKVAVGALQPLGCLPLSTAASSFRSCNKTQNAAVDYHNRLLQQAVDRLNLQARSHSFFIIDLHTAFMSVFSNKGGIKFENPLKACCIPTSAENSCGSIDNNGNKLYTVCSDPESTFFWDTVHPSQAGWRAVFSMLKPNLERIWN